jgi:hypothetical protein
MRTKTPGPWTIEEDREGGRRVRRIVAQDGNTIISTLDGVTGCLAGDLRRLPAWENEANAAHLASPLEKKESE